MFIAICIDLFELKQILITANAMSRADSHVDLSQAKESPGYNEDSSNELQTAVHDAFAVLGQVGRPRVVSVQREDGFY